MLPAIPLRSASNIMASDTSVRLYIGGLPGDITSKQLHGRFASFGSLSAVELVPSKHSPADGCRGFAYVDFTPKDDQALHRCFSLYNGCKWLGGVLRMEKAKPHYLNRLQTEWEANPESPAESQAAACIQESSVQEDPMRIPTPASSVVKRNLMVVKPRPVKRIFAPYKGERLSTLSWDPPPTPPGVRKRKAAEMAAAAFVSQPPVQQQPFMPQQPAQQQHEEQSSVLPGPPTRGNATQQTAAQQQQEPRQEEAGEEEQDQQAEASASSSDEGVVDFMSDDDNDLQSDGNKQTMGPGTDSNALSRFDDSEDEELRIQRPPQQAAAVVTARAAAPDLSRFGDSDDEDSQLQKPSTEAAAATAAWAPAAAADADKGKEQLQLQHSVDNDPHQQPAHAGALHQQLGATAAPAGDLSRFDDSDDEDDEDDEDDSRLTKQLKTLISKPSPLTPVTQGDSGASPAPAAASQLASLIASSSASDAASSQDNSLSDDDHACTHGNQQTPDSELALLRGSQIQQSTEHKQAMELEQLQPLPDADAPSDSGVDAQSTSDSEIGPELGSEVESGQCLIESSDESGAGIDEEDQLLSEGSDLAPQHHLDGTPMELPAAQQLDAQLATEDVETASDASEASEDSIQAEAVQPLAADAATEGAEDKGHGPVGGSGAAVQEAHLNEAPLYPDILTLQVGAAFWSQHQTTSDRAWQAQRQALHADYKAKHRAAAKHTHKGRKSRLT